MNKKKKLSKKTKIILFLLIFVLFSAVCYMGYEVYRKDKVIKIADLYFTGLSETKQIGKDTSDIEYSDTSSYVIIYPTIGNDIIDNNIKDIIGKLKTSYQEEYKDEKKVTLNLSEIRNYQYIDYETYLAPNNNMSLVIHEAITVDSKTVAERVYAYNISLTTGEILKDSYFFNDGYKDVIKTFLKDYLTTNDKYKDSLFTDYEKNLDKFKYIITNDSIKLYFDKGEILPESLSIITIEMPYDKISKYMDIDITKKTETPNINAGINSDKPIYTDVNKNMFIKQAINVYKSDNRNSEKIGTLDKGNEVSVISSSDTSWSKIKYNDAEAYVLTDYLSIDPVSVEGFNPTNETVYAMEDVHIRKEPNTNCDIIDSLKFKASITRIGTNDEWSEVLYNGQIAYIYSSYLSTTEPTTTSVNIPIDPTRNIDPNKPMVALTFDDGPNPVSTPRILDTLEKYDSVATFFDLGYLLTLYPKIVQREDAIGCEVGSHTYDHKDLTSLDTAGLQFELINLENGFISVLGHKPSIIRAPYGSVNSNVTSVINYPFINWDIDTLDWKTKNKDSIIAEVNKYSNLDGRIILMHSIYNTTADAVEELVPQLINKGYQLVTVPELAKYKGYTIESGKVYYDFR